MKKVIILCLLFAATKMSFAQGLSGLNYQAIARNLNGTVLDNKAVQVRFTITAGNGGAVQYRESQNVTTNAYGLFNVVIGKGAVLSGTFAGIPWSNANQWLEVEVAVAGANFISLGKMAFQSVPFSQMALQAFPAGPAGGDLSGSTYPNPAVAAQAITTGKLADNSVTTVKIVDANVTTPKLADGAVTAIKIATGVTLPPNGPAGGDLTGTYPNPAVAAQAITTGKLADNSVTTVKIVDANVTTPKLADGAVTAIKIAAGVIPASLPPNGAATGDLSGTYPAPTVAKLQGNTVSNTVPANGQVLTYNSTTSQWEPTALPAVAAGPWTRSNGRMSPTILTDNVGIGANIPFAKLEVSGFDDINNGYLSESGVNMVAGLVVKDKVSTGMSTKTGVYSYVNGATLVNASLMGDAGRNSNTNIGVWGTVLNAPAAGKVSVGVHAVDNIGSPNTYAAITDGKLKIINNNEGAGRVLTSDAGGNATWQDLVTPNVGISLFGVAAAVLVPSGVSTSITNWGTVRHQYGGANYNNTTGEYTITVTGVYQVNAAVSYLATAAGQMRLYVDVNGTNDNMNEVYATTINQFVMPQISYLRSFTTGDKVKLVAYQSSGVGQNIYGTNSSNGTQFSVQLIHKQ